MDDKKEEFLQKIKKIRHNFSKLVPTTIELMFDACLGIVYEDFVTKMAELDAREKASGPSSVRLGLLRAKAEGDLNHNRALVLYLKERVTSMYSEAKGESEKNKEKGREGAGQPDKPGAAPSGSEDGSGRGEEGPGGDRV